ncbi:MULTISPECIES: cytochrome C oxidase subunit IV family protein [unclassified Novosphingobium]|uniref:cytochrome C oxidase subunit IV family protein n=1 Tax=unclassified Novosphingobium TaxID=2644732 RepID=UPI00135C7D7B|nr:MULTISPECIES: cytochrome C oxidase subunit IV family protein [unclassified Novosphingobium]
MDKGDRKLLIWWAVLVALTLLSFESGLQWLGQAGAGTALVIVIALVKIRTVVLHFMDVREAPWALRAPLEIWVIALGAALPTLWYGHVG